VLGLRHYRGAAIDLFQGDLALFVCDAMVYGVAAPSGSVASGQVTVEDPGRLPARNVFRVMVPPVMDAGSSSGVGVNQGWALAYEHSLKEADRLHLRHIGFALQAAHAEHVHGSQSGQAGDAIKSVAEIAVQTIKTFLDATEAKDRFVKRVTLVLSTHAEYQVFQRALFSLFPEL
jgi:O-acetyl-ADP-ribose deacetylase (regulator of RNase III)